MDLKLRLADDMRLGRLAVCASLVGSSLLPVPPNTPAPTADLVRIQAHPGNAGNTVGGRKALNSLPKPPIEAAAAGQWRVTG